MTKICENCNKDFLAQTTKTRYCSHSCNSRHYKHLKRIEKIQEATEKEARKKVDTTVFEAITIKDFLRINEAALLLGLSQRTFYRLMRDGTIKTHKLGGTTIIQRSDINNLFK